MFDIILKNALIADGTGSPLYESDIAVKDGKIATIGRLCLNSAQRTIDVNGCMVAPGFIDIHSHTDDVVFIQPASQSKITQGITTEVSGNCGASPAPILDEASRIQHDHWRETYCIKDDWTTMGEFLDAVDKKKLAVNFATFVGHSAVRSAVVGHNNRPPTPDELKKMQNLVAQAMREGAFGLSTGLIYAPSCFADTKELIELAKAIKPSGGVYASHIRSERNELVESVDEAITIGREAEVSVEISHHKACGRNNWGKVKDTLAMIEEAWSEGLDVNCDHYPYLAGATGLSILLPKWAHDGGSTKTMERLKGSERKKIQQEIRKASTEGWIANDGGWESVVISGVTTEAHKHFEGLNMLEIAGLRGSDPVDAVIELLIEEELRVGVILFSQCEEDMQMVMKHPATMIGTDATARALSGPMSKGKPHPRSYGTFPRILGSYVRDKGIISPEQAIMKMSSMPARKLGLKDRGMVKEGMWADLVVFDPDKIADTATYQDPHRISIGINYVLVNGEVAVEYGELTGVMAGRALRKESRI